MRRWLRALSVWTLAVIASMAPAIAAAQDYPTRPITMIVPFPAGGATDTLARYLAERMRPILGQPIIIENVAGAAGSIGVGRAVRAPADGYTLSIGTSTTHMLTGGLYALPVRPVEGPGAGHPDRQRAVADRRQERACRRTIWPDLIAYLKANPDKASVGIAGVGATGHLTGIAFQKATGTRFQFVPYRGNAPAMQDLLAGQIDFMVEPSSNFKALLGTKSVKPFAITGRTRLASSSDIPTADAAGLPGFFASLWYGLWVPKGTPKDIIAKLNVTMVQVLANPSTRKRLDDLGIQVAPHDQQSPEALQAFQKAEAERWWPIIKASGLKGE